MKRSIVLGWSPLRMAPLVLVLGSLAGCEDGPQLGFLQPKDKPASASPAAGQSTKLVERDVEAPDEFQVTEAGLWDGRPSLGGVWVAHPDVSDPLRVIIRNSANNKFVIGALFRREREIPGPRVQASSDAAAALGMLAGAPVQLNITALVREAVPDEAPAAGSIKDTSEDIAQTQLDPIAGAAAAIDAADPSLEAAKVAAAAAAPTAAPATPPTAPPAPPPRRSSLGKPYIQIGIFSVKSNANRTANLMRNDGMVPTVFEQKANGKPFWRVVVGPAQSSSERNSLLKKVKKAGFSDAYFVSK